MRTWHVNRMVYVKRDLMLATYKRNLDLFRRVIVETVLMSVASSLIYATHRYLKERLSLIWREKLTKQLHRKYFTRMNYYRLSHLNRGEIADVEERMVKDPRRFCKSLAEEMEKASAAVTSGVWFTYKLTTISSLPFALAPLAYFYCSWKAALLFAPNWSVKWRKMLDLRSKYFGTQGRLQTHAEAVCAYQGNAVERNIIETAWNNFMDYCVLFMRDATLFEFVSSAFFVYGSHTMAATLILSRYISPDGSEAKRNYMQALRDMPSGGASASSAAQRRGYNNASALLFSEIRYLTEYFIRAMSAQGVIIQVLRQLMQMQGPAGRLAELFDTLDKFDAETEASTQFEEDGDKIAFRDVQVYTPTDVMLLKDLNFSVQRGMNLLLTGCNGSGKSSIFRCLGGLWKIPEGGVITKPGGNSTGLNNAVFYLPQKPYNVLGTLRAQLLYPESKGGAEQISDAYLRELLDAVDLGYLMERGPQGPNDDREVDWESVLSMGEKQRLAMARLFYHQPSYAILDECTSGVSASMERRLYESCAARNITCITISHRPVLEQYHDVVLNVLKDGLGGWDFRMTQRGRERKAAGSMVFDADMERVAADESHRSALSSERAGNGSGAAGTAGEGGSVLSPTILGDGYTEVGGVSKAYLAAGGAGASTQQGQLERQRLERRSKKYRALAADGSKTSRDDAPVASTALATTSVAGQKERRGRPLPLVGARRDISTYRRMKDVWDRGFMPDGMSLRDPEARRILLLASMVIAKTLAADSIAFFDGYILTTVLQNDFSVFIKASLTGAVMRTSLAFFDAAITRQKWYLNLAWRKRLTSYLLSKYFSYNTFYDVKNQDDRISDPEERFTEQVEQLSVSLTDLWTNLLKPGFDITFNLVMLYRTLGNTAVGGMAAYMLSAAALLRFIVPNFRQNVRKQYKLEGRFRFVHTRLSVHTESVAFFGGDDVEHEVCNNRLDELKGHIEKTQLQSLRFNIFNNFMVRQTPDLAAFTLRMYYAMAASAAVGADIASTGEYIQQTVMRTFKSFGDAFELQETMGNFIGTLENVSDLMYALEDLAAKQVSVQSDDSKATRLGRSADGSIEFKGVDIVAPGEFTVFFCFVLVFGLARPLFVCIVSLRFVLFFVCFVVCVGTVCVFALFLFATTTVSPPTPRLPFHFVLFCRADDK